mgnify:CR=1 FL=1
MLGRTQGYQRIHEGGCGDGAASDVQGAHCDRGGESACEVKAKDDELMRDISRTSRGIACRSPSLLP